MEVAVKKANARKLFAAIYLIETPANGKKYVGSAVDLMARWSTHISHLRGGVHGNVHLQRAWHKYGVDGFRFSVIEFVDDLSTLMAREQHWIDALDVFRNGYNRRPEASSNLGWRATAQTRARMSAAAKGKRKPPRDPLHTAKIAEANRGRPLSESTKLKLRVLNLGRKHSTETREYISNFNRAKWSDPQHRANHIASWKLDRATIHRILDEHEMGESKRALATKHGVSRRMISYIVNGVSYADYVNEWRKAKNEAINGNRIATG